jgi:hypothetical protein
VLTVSDTWTVEEACEQFRQAGVPMDPDGLRIIIRHLPGFPFAGRAPSRSPQGGRGATLHPIADLQRLHGKLAEWLIPQDSQSGG